MLAQYSVCVFSFFYFLYRISSLHRMSSFIVKVMCLNACLACSPLKLLVRYMHIVVWKCCLHTVLAGLFIGMYFLEMWFLKLICFDDFDFDSEFWLLFIYLLKLLLLLSNRFSFFTKDIWFFGIWLFWCWYEFSILIDVT